MSSRKAARVALALLLATTLYLLLVATDASERFVPAASGGGPDWLLGLFGYLNVELPQTLTTAAAFYIGLWLLFGCYLVITKTANALTGKSFCALLLLVFLLFTLAPPLLSQDIFSYLSYSRLSVEHGLNPYLHTPAAAAGDPVFSYLGWRDAVSAYGPLFTVITLPFAALSLPAAIWGLKALALAAAAGALLLISNSARKLGLEPKVAVAFVAFNPLLLVHVIGGGHNEALLMLLLSLSIYLALTTFSYLSAAAALAAAFLKVSAAPTVLLALLAADRRRQALTATAAALLILAALSLALFGDSLLKSLAIVGENQARTSFYSLPNQLARLGSWLTGVDRGDLLSVLRPGAGAAYLLLILWLALRVLRDRSYWITASGWALIGLLLTTSWLLPWYIAWPLPFVALSRSRPLQITTLALTAYMLMIRLPL